MTELEKEIHERFLDRLDQPWNDEDPRLDFGSAALPCFVAALHRDNTPERRVRLIRIIWQFRDPAAFPTLATALCSQSGAVWKEALDGIAALGGDQALSTLSDARIAMSSDAEKLAWIDEALDQVAQKIGSPL
jgi:hypothetical protein